MNANIRTSFIPKQPILFDNPGDGIRPLAAPVAPAKNISGNWIAVLKVLNQIQIEFDSNTNDLIKY
jgi:hypothetical protein